MKKLRMLNLDLPTAPEHYLEQEGGGLLVRGVVLLAEGTWTDSAVRTPLYYPREVLERCAKQWESSTYWARHAGGQPRNIVTDRLGEVLDTRYDAKLGAIVGDVLYDGLTQASRDGAALALGRVRMGKPLAVSVEWYGDAVYNAKEKREEAVDIHFTGLAAVDRGACKRCTLPAALEDADQNQSEGENMDEAELNQKLAAFKEELLAAVDEKLAAFKDSLEGGEGPAEPENKEMSEAVDKLTKELSEAMRKIEALEKRPQPRTAPEPDRELDELIVPEGYTVRRS